VVFAQETAAWKTYRGNVKKLLSLIIGDEVPDRTAEGQKRRGRWTIISSSCGPVSHAVSRGCTFSENPTTGSTPSFS
jgi:hypothetical protein